jgi:hypothetical protein
MLGVPVLLFRDLPPAVQVVLGVPAGLIFGFGWIDDIGRAADARLAKNGKPSAWNEDSLKD